MDSSLFGELQIFNVLWRILLEFCELVECIIEHMHS